MTVYIPTVEWFGLIPAILIIQFGQGKSLDNSWWKNRKKNVLKIHFFFHQIIRTFVKICQQICSECLVSSWLWSIYIVFSCGYNHSAERYSVNCACTDVVNWQGGVDKMWTKERFSKIALYMCIITCVKNAMFS